MNESPVVRGLHPLVAAAAEGRLPPWAEAGPRRRAHMGRVAALMDAWARALGLPAEERARWRAAAWLHDALRDAPEASLRPWLAPSLADLPSALAHGPATAARLAAEGVGEEDLLDAVRWHTLGHPELRRIGRALYAADFLEPDRRFLSEWRAALRGRMPSELDTVVKEILRARILNAAEGGQPLRPETRAFWENVSGGEAWPAGSGR